MTKITDDAIRAALTFIPANDQDLWVRVGMALKSEYGAPGFELFETWSQTGENFDAKAVKARWKSFKAAGGITVGTLIAEAKKRGFDPKKYTGAAPMAPEEKARLQKEKRERDQAAAAEIQKAQKLASKEALRIWAGASSNGTSLYLDRKKVAGYGVRFAGDVLLVPVLDADGKLWNVQRVQPSGEKFFLKDGRVSGCFHIIGDPAASDWLLIAEGYATAATLHQATGYAVAVAFNAGNVKHVAKALRRLHPVAKLMLCADDDSETEQKTGKNPGIAAATEAAAAIGAPWCKPSSLPAGGTDFNDLFLAAGAAEVNEQLQAAIAAATHESADVCTTINKAKDATREASAATKKATGNAGDPDSRRPFFRVDDIGVWYHGFSQQGDPLPPQWICSPLHVTAKTRDASGGEWGYLLEFSDGDGAAKRWAMPASMLAADGAEYRRTLLSMGLQIAPGLNAKNQLSIYIQTRQLDVRARCVDRVGWNEDAYVFPDRTIGDRGERVLFQAAGGVLSQFRQSGSIDGWRENVAKHCQGNSRLAFCVSAAFAGPLLHHAGIESGGFHLVGDSSSGKTTALRVAASVYGGKDYTRTWRATSNALESTAAQHSDGLLILDEIGQVDPKEVGEVVYMLGNEAGKSRSTQTATSRKVQTWRLLFLSSGETSLSDHMSAGGKGARGGHDVRMAQLRADAGKGFGLFDHLHDFASGAALAEHLNTQAKQHYGTAGLAFIEWLVARADRLSKGLQRRVANLAHELCPAESHGQVSRVAARFALVGVAGELATAAGITGWTEGEARDAAQICFKAWLADRGGAGNIEHVSIVRQVRNFMSLHGEARFVWVQRSLDDHRPNTMHRAGFKRMIKDDGSAINSKLDYSAAFGHEAPSMLDAESILIEYLVSPDIFRNEICKGFDHRAVSKLLSARGFLKVDAEGRSDIKIRIPGMGAPRFYCIQPAIFNGDE